MLTTLICVICRTEIMPRKIGMSTKSGVMSENISMRWTEERSRLGFSQADIARNVGVSRETMRKWENGLGEVSVGALEIAASLGFDVLYVITGRRASVVPANPTIAATVTNGIGIVQQGGNVHYVQTQKHMTNTRAVLEPGSVHISEDEARTLTDLVNKVVELERVVRVEPRSIRAVWGALNAHCGVTRYRLIPKERFPQARKYLDQWMGRLNSAKSAPVKDGDNWRRRRYAYIKVNSKSQADAEALATYISTNFGANSLADLSNDELERAYRYVASCRNRATRFKA